MDQWQSNKESSHTLDLFQLPHLCRPLLLPPTNSSTHLRLPGPVPEETVYLFITIYGTL